MATISEANVEHRLFLQQVYTMPAIVLSVALSASVLAVTVNELFDLF